MRYSFPQRLRPLFLLLTLLLLSAAQPLCAQTPVWLDAVSPGAGGGCRPAVDAAGNIYVTGSFSGTATFGTTTLTSAGGADMFVAKRTPAGTWQWATSAGGSGYEGSAAVAVDGSGNVVVTGNFSSPTVTFGTTTLTNATGYSHPFVAKLTPTGVWQWAAGSGGSGNGYGSDVAVDGSGNVVVTGTFFDPVTFGTTTLTYAGGSGDIFVAKLTPTGAWQWATGAGGYGDDYGKSVAVDGSGNVVVTGSFGGMLVNPATFGAITLTPGSVGGALFVAKLTPAGAWQWATAPAGYDSSSSGNGVAVDGSGNVVVTGFFVGHGSGFSYITFGATTLMCGGDCTFVVKLTPAGAWQWATSTTGGGYNGYGVAVDGSGSVVVTGGFQSPTLTFGATTLTNAGSADIFVAKLTPTGAWQWAIGVGGSGDDYSGGVAVDGSGNVVVTGSFRSRTIAFGVTTLTNPTPGSNAIFLARLLPDGDVLGGTVYLDTNGDGTRNAGEGLAQLPVVVEGQPGPFYLTTTAGAFGVGVPPGTYTLALPNPLGYYAATPATHSAVFTAANQVDTTNHFGLHPTGSFNDLRVTLTATSAYRTGRDVQYVITCDNPGTTTQTGITAAIALDPRITYTSSVPAATTVSGQTVTWNVGTLAPLQSRTFVVNGTLPITIQRGDSVTSVATLTSALAEVTPADNTDVNTTIIVGSYDPNDKQVSAERLTPAQVQAGTWLTYTIRFQNTGNDTAFVVGVRDTLSAHVQRGTLEVLAASHPMTWQLKGAGVADFRFNNILLPDSGRNEVASHGFVKYRVRVLPTLALGDEVRNAADIYFDFNAPVRTNTAVTQVRMPLGTGAATPRLQASLYPNPATHTVRVTLETPTANVLQLRVLNPLGQVVWQEQTAVANGQVNRNLPAGQWPAGVYHVQIRCGAQSTTQQLVVQP